MKVSKLLFCAVIALSLLSCSKNPGGELPVFNPDDRGGQADPGSKPKPETLSLSLIFIENPTDKSFKWPFSSPEVSKIATSFGVGSSSFPGEVKDYTLVSGTMSYTFHIFATTGVSRNSGSSHGLKFGESVGDYMEFPSVPGKALVSVKFVSGITGHPGSPMICDRDGYCPEGGDPLIKSFTAKGDSFTWELYNTEIGVPYRLQLTEEGVIHMQQLHLVYSTEVKEAASFEDDLEVRKDTIPDFSRVGYHYGDREIPDIPVKSTLNAPADGSDALKMIQDAIDNVQTPGAVLLKAGRYNVSGTIKITKSGVVLRGEGESTVLYSTAMTQQDSFIQLGDSTKAEYGTSCRITAKYVPVGQMWVPVSNPSMFSVGETVFVYRPATEKWLDAIHMREIYDDGTVTQWTTGAFSIYWERRVTAIEGNRIYLENPIVMGIGGDGYGTGRLVKGSQSRISECGIENLTLDTRYDASKRSKEDYIDEEHCWNGISVNAVENSWIRNVTTHHFGGNAFNLYKGSKNITVTGCRSLEPVSEVKGGRRYAFHFSQSQLCIIKDCFCDDDRHEYVCGSKVPGPNVFLRCRSTNNREEAGPHQRWTTGVLYDNVVIEGGELNIHDRGDYGTGQGWTSANVVLYNCEAASFVCQSPWASAQNWAIGCIGTKKRSDRTYKDNLGTRPDGIWISPGVHVSPESLYESQLAERHAKGIFLE